MMPIRSRATRARTIRRAQRRPADFLLPEPPTAFRDGGRVSAIDVLDGLLPTRWLALHPVPEQVRHDHEIPAAAEADLDHHDLELAELVGHLLQLRDLLDPAGVLTELFAEHVVQLDQVRG